MEKKRQSVLSLTALCAAAAANLLKSCKQLRVHLQHAQADSLTLTFSIRRCQDEEEGFRAAGSPADTCLDRHTCIPASGAINTVFKLFRVTILMSTYHKKPSTAANTIMRCLKA